MSKKNTKAILLVLFAPMIVQTGCGGGANTSDMEQPELGAANPQIDQVQSTNPANIVNLGITGLTTVYAASEEQNSTDNNNSNLLIESNLNFTTETVVRPEPEPEPESEIAPYINEEKKNEPTTTPPLIDTAIQEPSPQIEEPLDPATTQTSQPIIQPNNNVVDSNSVISRHNSIGSEVGDVIKILDRLPVSTSQLTTQMTPIDNQDGYVYVANIEHGPNGDSNDTTLRTVLRQGIQLDDNSWEWKSSLIEDRTVHDAWHTGPGIAVDREGTVHIAYNMHNTPWQYKRSSKPHDISNFTFHGQFISQEELNRWKFENKTYFPTFGTAAIHGNQVTYPRFAKNNSGELYVTYRFAARPKQSFKNRVMSSGLSKYDYETQEWNSIGVPFPAESEDYVADLNAPDNATIVAGQSGWTSYLPRLMFGPDDELHISMYWREGTAGGNMTRPCHFYSRDEKTFSDISGADIVLPIKPGDCSNIGYSDLKEFYSVGTSVMDSEKTPHILTSPINEPREIVSYDNVQNKWIKAESPHNAVEIFFDHQDTMWALATGLKVLKKAKGDSQWTKVYEAGESNDCYPRASVNKDKSIAYIHTHACDSKSVTVYAIRLK